MLLFGSNDSYIADEDLTADVNAAIVLKNRFGSWRTRHWKNASGSSDCPITQSKITYLAHQIHNAGKGRFVYL